MFHRPDDNKTREWSKLLANYIALHKYIKEVGKIGIIQARSGQVNNDVQIKLYDGLKQADKALFNLKKFFKPCLTNVDVTDMFPEETDTTDLVKEISKLKHENLYLENQLIDQYELHSQRDDVQIRDLKRELSISQQIFDKNRNIFMHEKQDLEHKVLELENRCQLLTLEMRDLKALVHPQLEQLRNGKQQQFEETLQAQNYLIEELKQQLTNAARDRETLKTLNRNLETELQKNKQPNNDVKQEQAENNDDYYHRGTLRIEDYEALNHEHHKNFAFHDTEQRKASSESKGLFKSEMNFFVTKGHDVVDYEQQKLEQLRYEAQNLEKQLLKYRDENNYLVQNGEEQPNEHEHEKHDNSLTVNEHAHPYYQQEKDNYLHVI